MIKSFWKLYATLFSILGIISILMALSSAENIFWIEYIPRVMIVLIAIVGLVGYAWRVSMGKLWFWRALFFLVTFVLISTIFRNYGIGGIQQICSGLWCSVANYLIGILFTGPLFWGLYSYAFRSSELWEKK